MGQVFGFLGRVLIGVVVSIATFLLCAVIAGLTFGFGPSWLPMAVVTASVVCGITAVVMVGRKGRRARLAAVAETEVADAEPVVSASQPVTPPTVRVVTPRKPFKLTPLGVAVAIGGFGLSLGLINNDGVSALVHQFFDERSAELGGPVTIERIDVPIWAFLLPSYEISVTYHRDSAPDEFRIARPRIDGNCLLRDCSVSIRRGDLLAN